MGYLETELEDDAGNFLVFKYQLCKELLVKIQCQILEPGIE